MTITIYHNPQCSKSRKTLALIEERGITPVVVLYLIDAPSAKTTLQLASWLGVPVAALLRSNEEEFIAARKLLDLADDAALAAWLERHPRVLQRPIVTDEASGRAIIGRPPENVLELLST
jgi:arsenate reductase